MYGGLPESTCTTSGHVFAHLCNEAIDLTCQQIVDLAACLGPLVDLVPFLPTTHKSWQNAPATPKVCQQPMSYLTLDAERELRWQAAWVRRHGQDITTDFWPSALIRLPPLHLRAARTELFGLLPPHT